MNGLWLFGIQSFQQPAELLLGYLPGFFTGSGPLKAPVLKTLVQKTESVTFIVDCFDPVCASAAEQEQCIAVRIKLKVILNDINQTIQLLPHICISCTDIDFFNMREIA